MQHLLAEKGNIVNMGNGLFRYGLVVHKPLDRPPLDNMLLDDFGDIINADLLVKNPFGITTMMGPAAQKPLQPVSATSTSSGKAALCNFLYQRRMYHFAAGCLAAGAATDECVEPETLSLVTSPGILLLAPRHNKFALNLPPPMICCRNICLILPAVRRSYREGPGCSSTVTRGSGLRMRCSPRS